MKNLLPSLTPVMRMLRPACICPTIASVYGTGSRRLVVGDGVDCLATVDEDNAAELLYLAPADDALVGDAGVDDALADDNRAAEVDGLATSDDINGAAEVDRLAASDDNGAAEVDRLAASDDDNGAAEVDRLAASDDTDTADVDWRDGSFWLAALDDDDAEVCRLAASDDDAAEVCRLAATNDAEAAEVEAEVHRLAASEEGDAAKFLRLVSSDDEDVTEESRDVEREGGSLENNGSLELILNGSLDDDSVKVNGSDEVARIASVVNWNDVAIDNVVAADEATAEADADALATLTNGMLGNTVEAILRCQPVSAVDGMIVTVALNVVAK
jgi:hypothetical protein